jgi:S-formylglutathione hydrolase FrmB
MSVAVQSSRTHVWLEGLGEWSWPGRGGVAVEALPPAWVPAFPPRSALVVPQPSLPEAAWPSQPAIQRRLGAGALASALAAACAAVALNGPLSLERLIGVPTASPVARSARPLALAAPAQPAPTLAPVSHGAADSWVVSASYHSRALHGKGSFLTYLPPGYASTTLRYPVLYLLTGTDQSDEAFLQIGLQGTLDRLIAAGTIQPLIAVMIQGGWGSNNWRDEGRRGYASYVLEVQELVDRMLPTIARRGARAIAGVSSGGFGAMHIALANPDRFAVVESWLGFFDGLDRQLRADRPVLSSLGLHAFLYGGESDKIANPSENAPFAAALRAAGASAASAIYAGGHSLETIHAHLGHMVVFAAHAMPAGTGSPQTAAQLATASVRSAAADRTSTAVPQPAGGDARTRALSRRR